MVPFFEPFENRIEFVLVLEQNAYCFGDTEQALQQRCVDACRNQSGMPLVRIPAVDGSFGAFKEDVESTCKVGVCVVKCLSAQVCLCLFV